MVFPRERKREIERKALTKQPSGSAIRAPNGSDIFEGPVAVAENVHVGDILREKQQLAVRRQYRSTDHQSTTSSTHHRHRGGVAEQVEKDSRNTSDFLRLKQQIANRGQHIGSHSSSIFDDAIEQPSSEASRRGASTHQQSSSRRATASNASASMGEEFDSIDLNDEQQTAPTDVAITAELVDDTQVRQLHNEVAALRKLMIRERILQQPPNQPMSEAEEARLVYNKARLGTVPPPTLAAGFGTELKHTETIAVHAIPIPPSEPHTTNSKRTWVLFGVCAIILVLMGGVIGTVVGGYSRSDQQDEAVGDETFPSIPQSPSIDPRKIDSANPTSEVGDPSNSNSPPSRSSVLGVLSTMPTQISTQKPTTTSNSQSRQPQAMPTATPLTAIPTISPSSMPSSKTLYWPSAKPSSALVHVAMPTISPSSFPSPSEFVTKISTDTPSIKPTGKPTSKPTSIPTLPNGNTPPGRDPTFTPPEQQPKLNPGRNP